MTFELDPDRKLYVPGRRRFLFLSGLAMAGTVVKGLAQEPRTHTITFRWEDPPRYEFVTVGPDGFVRNPILVRAWGTLAPDAHNMTLRWGSRVILSSTAPR